MTGAAERRTAADDDAEFFRAGRSFVRSGIAVFPPDQETRDWADAMRAVAIASLHWPGVRHRADGTWLEADLGPHDGLAPLVGPSLRFLRRALGRPRLHLTQAQLSVILPGHPRGDAWHVDTLSRHIDGAPTPDRLVLSPAILGVLLCDLQGPGRGNPLAWDGSHLVTAAQLRRLAPDGTPAAVAAALHGGLPLDPRLCPPRIVTGPAGTAFIYHHGLQHGIAPYPGAEGPPRPVLYYRMSMPTPDDTRVLTDPLHHWPGLLPLPR